MDEHINVTTKSLTLFEKIINFKSFMLFLALALFLDICSLLLFKNNFLITFINFDIEYKAIYYFIFLLLFGFLMAVCCPSLRILTEFGISFFYKNNDDEDYFNSKDYKYIDSLKQQANKNKDIYLLSLVEKEESINKEIKQELNIYFAVGVFSLFDIAMDNSLLNYVYLLMQGTTGIFFLIYSLLFLIFFVTIGMHFWISIKPSQLEKIYLPNYDE